MCKCTLLEYTVEDQSWRSRSTTHEDIEKGQQLKQYGIHTEQTKRPTGQNKKSRTIPTHTWTFGSQQSWHAHRGERTIHLVDDVGSTGYPRGHFQHDPCLTPGTRAKGAGELTTERWTAVVLDGSAERLGDFGGGRLTSQNIKSNSHTGKDGWICLHYSSEHPPRKDCKENEKANHGLGGSIWAQL